MSTVHDDQPTLFGHPTGLYTLFFAEMWERFSYYGMRALLVFYMLKGFLAYGDNEAYKVYGAYTAMVYLTPFFGGFLADRLLGARRAVVFGGLLMAAGHLTMTQENELPFFIALALLIVGNGFFKPNISTIVGSLYPDGDPRRDGGFTIFYMGINLGAAMAPLLCGFVGETYGWHYGFGLATVGMLVGLAVFVMPTKITQALVLGGAIATAASMVFLVRDSTLLLAVNGFVALALVISGVAAFTALGRGGLPDDSGEAPDLEYLHAPIWRVPVSFLRAATTKVDLVFTREHLVYLGTFVAVPCFAALVWSNRLFTVIPESVLKPMVDSESSGVHLAGTLLGEMSTLPGVFLTVTGLFGFIYLFRESLKSAKIERERLWVVLVLMFFSMLFWSFFEQAGSSVNNFTDRNVDRVLEDRQITQNDVGQTLTFRVGTKDADAQVASLPYLSQEQLGYTLGDAPMTITRLTEMRDAAGEDDALASARTVDWLVLPSQVGMGVATSEIPASPFQSANPIYIILLGLGFSSLWSFLARRKMEPSTPVKFSLGLLQLGLGFVVLWYGAKTCDPRGMVGMSWLLLGYLLHTTGELCLSPVGLSMVTKLSPKRLVSTAMGAWFLATAFSSFLAAIIATFTGVSHGSGESAGVPIPLETVGVYGGVFGSIAVAAIGVSVLSFALAPLLTRWMHIGEEEGEEAA